MGILDQPVRDGHYTGMFRSTFWRASSQRCSLAAGSAASQRLGKHFFRWADRSGDRRTVR